MNNQLETYGKQNIVKNIYYNFSNNKYTDNFLNKFGLRSYSPKIKRWKLGLASLSLICLIPGLPIFIIPISFIWAIK